MIELFGLLQVGHSKTDHFLLPVVVKMSAMAEFHRYPLRVQQSKLDGWWFIFVDEVPGLGVVGPNFEDLLNRLKVLVQNGCKALAVNTKPWTETRPAGNGQACCPCLVRSVAASAASSESITNAARCSLGFLSNQVH
jgi:predicted RNase H-like HicB family nuclease